MIDGILKRVRYDKRLLGVVCSLGVAAFLLPPYLVLMALLIFLLNASGKLQVIRNLTKQADRSITRKLYDIRLIIISRLSPTPILKRIVVERGKEPLSLCYVTSRIIMVSQTSLSSKEQIFLESKYSNFLKHLPSPNPSEISPLATVSAIVETAVQHLFSNPINVVSISAPPDDVMSILVISCLLLRTGVVNPPTALKALKHMSTQRYSNRPSPERLLPKCLLSQLGIFEQIMTRPASKERIIGRDQFWFKRVVISNFDAEGFSDLRLSLCDVETGEVIVEDVSPSVSTNSITFIGKGSLGSDTVMVLSGSDGDVVLKTYFHSGFHLERALASTSTYHYITSTDDCDHWSGKLKNVTARIEILASSDGQHINIDEKNINRDLLFLPPTYSKQSSNCCLIVYMLLCWRSISKSRKDFPNAFFLFNNDAVDFPRSSALLEYWRYRCWRLDRTPCIVQQLGSCWWTFNFVCSSNRPTRASCFC
jgi:hypothetical protein